MSKTYSVAIQSKKGTWFTNYGEYFKLDDIDFDAVKRFCIEHNEQAYGYYYGIHSRKLTSARCRTVLEVIT